MIACQFVKFAVVGLVSNGALYLAYLLLTWLGVGPKLAMTLLYILGTVQTFAFNHRWTFRSVERYGAAFTRYVFTYASGYLLNLAVLACFVDLLSFPHQVVQGIMILALAVYNFVLMRVWVFKATGFAGPPAPEAENVAVMKVTETK